MNTFYEHHKGSIKFAYRCFDRILLNGLIQPFQQPERVIGFFNAYRNAERVTRNCLRDIAQQFHNWVKNRCERWGAPILDAPEGRRDDFLDSYFRHGQKRCGGSDSQSQGTCPDHDCDRLRRTLAPAASAALDRPVQLLHQRPTLGSDVRTSLPLSALFSTCLPQSAPLAG